eukprot:UN09753
MSRRSQTSWITGDTLSPAPVSHLTMLIRNHVTSLEKKMNITVVSLPWRQN